MAITLREDSVGRAGGLRAGGSIAARNGLDL